MCLQQYYWSIEAALSQLMHVSGHGIEQPLEQPPLITKTKGFKLVLFSLVPLQRVLTLPPPREIVHALNSDSVDVMAVM